MEWLMLALVGVVAAGGGYVLWRRFYVPSGKGETAPTDTSSDGSSTPEPAESLTQVATGLNEKMETCWHPRQLLEDRLFARGLELLKEEKHSTEDLLIFAFSDNKAISCLALQALRSHAACGPIMETIVAKVDDLEDWPKYFALGLLDACDPPPASLIGKVLTRINLSYQNPLGLQFLRQFLKDRLSRGEKPEWACELRELSDERLEAIRKLIAGLDTPEAASSSDQVKELSLTRVNSAFLSSMGMVWPPAVRHSDVCVEHDRLLADASRLESLLLGTRPKSVVVLGENGVGKSTLFRLVAERLQLKGWTIFQAGHSELVAGKSYIGEFEEGMKARLEPGRRRSPRRWPSISSAHPNA